MADLPSEILAREELLRQAQLGEGAPDETKGATEPALPAADALAELQRVMDDREITSARRPDTLFGSDATPSERALAVLNADIARRLPGAPMETGTVRHGIGALAQTAANIGGIALSPVLGPLTRPAENTEEGIAFARGSGMQRLANEVGRSQEAAQSFFRSLGIIPADQPPTPQSLIEHVGADLLPAVISAGAVLWGAKYASRLAGTDYLARYGLTGGPTTAAGPSTVPGLGAVGRVMTQARARPVEFVGLTAASQPPASATREALAPVGESLFGPYESASTGAYVGRALWDFTTEALGGTVAAGVLGRMGRSNSRFGFIPDRETLSPLTRPSAPIMSAAAEPGEAAQIARLQAVYTIDTFDRMIASAIDTSAAPGLSRQAAGIELHGKLAAARTFAHETTQRAYAQVPDAAGEPTDTVLEVLRLMDLRSRQSGGLGQNVDLPYLADLERQLFQRDHTGAVIHVNGVPQYRRDVTLQEMISIRSEIMHRADRAADSPAAGGQGRRVERDLLEGLHEAATRDIEQWLVPGSPGHQAWQYANDLYRTFNDRFRRGPVERMLRTGPYAPEAAPGVTLQPGQANVPPIELAQQLLRADDTAEAVFRAGMPFGTTVNAGPTLQAAMDAAASGVRMSAGDAIRATFRDTIERAWLEGQERVAGKSLAPDVLTQYPLQAGPGAATVGAANRFMRDNDHLFRSWTDVTSDMWTTVSSLNRLMRARNEYTTSVVSQFIGRPIDDVIREALDAPDRAARFADLYRSLSHNSDALEGVRRATINRLFHGHGADPNIALARLQSRPYSEALTELFRGDIDRLNRFYDMVRVGAELIGPNVVSTARGAARLDDKGVVRGMGGVSKALRAVTINLAGMFLGLVPGHMFARMLPGAGSAAQLSIPLRMSTTARKIVASAWLGERGHALEILRDAIFDPRMETYINMVSPGPWREARRQFDYLTRSLRTAQRAANGDVEDYLEGNWRAEAAAERRRYFTELDRIRKGPFRE